MTGTTAPDALTAARAALATHDWELAYTQATTAVAEPAETSSREDHIDRGVRLDVLAEAAWWVGRLDACIANREAAYASFEEAGANRAAGRCAYSLFHHWNFQGKPAIASGWLRRARRVLEGDVDCPEYGFLLLYESEVAHGAGELDRATELAEQARVLARRLRDPDVEAHALQSLGRILIDDARATEGFAYLDEAMLFAIEGRLTPFVTGRVYCSLMSACHDFGDLHRANEWMQAVGSWADGHPFAVFPGLCRLHRAEFLQWRGEWVAAEAEARRAGDELEVTFLANAGSAYAEVGEIRRRVGDLDGAEEAFARAEALGTRPVAGVALLRLAQGRTDAADTMLRGALGETGWNQLHRAWLLAADVQVALTAGDVDRARASAGELGTIADRFQGDMLRATAATALGRVQLATDDVEAAVTLRLAVQAWSDLGVPYEVATARLLLASALRAAGDEEGAARCSTGAEELFARLGAAVDLEEPPPAAERELPCGLTAREVEVLRLVAAGDTNKRIAAALFLSEKTVGRHLSNIFAKIDVSSRAAATAFAFEHDLVHP